MQQVNRSAPFCVFDSSLFARILGFNVALVEPWWSLGVALLWLYPRITVALPSQSPPNPLPITWLVCGFDMALGGFVRLAWPPRPGGR